MSRLIKFRAWYPGECFQDGKARMFHDVAISAKGKPMHLEGGWDYMGDEEKAIPMQFTGLHDRNGVEIYEGDIISVRWETGEVTRHTVEYCDRENYPAFELSPRIEDAEMNGLYFVAEGIDYCEGEVIGNIYENPELLEQRND